MVNNIITNLKKLGVSRSDILVLTISEPPISSDVDVYCITKKKKSSVHMFYDDDHIWNEYYIDNILDTEEKLSNVDEIVTNFLLEMKYVLGDLHLYHSLSKKAVHIKNHYKIPNDRSKIIKYRIKVLSTKYTNQLTNTSTDQKTFITNSLSYPIMQLALSKYGILPSSPKKWMMQLEKNIPQTKYKDLQKLLHGKCDSKFISKLVDEYAGDIDTMSIDKSSNNKITFIS